MKISNHTFSYLTALQPIVVKKNVGSNTLVYRLLIALFIIILSAISLIYPLSINLAERPIWLMLFITAHDAMPGSVFPKNPEVNTSVGKLALFAYGVFSYITCYHSGYDEEHHEYPSVPWWQLPAIHKLQTQLASVSCTQMRGEEA